MPEKTISVLEVERYHHIECACQNPVCRNTVWVPFRMIRERRPRLMLSAMTITQLGKLMPCSKCGNRDKVIYKAIRQEDGPGYAKTFTPQRHK